MRAVAQLAGVSPQQAAVVIGRLVELGVVQRREVPPALLVRLSPDSLAAQAVVEIAGIRRSVIARLTELAAQITPPPASLVVFGSFARGEADADSDIDVLAVRQASISEGDDAWADSLGRWVDRATGIAGSPVNVVEAAADAVGEMLRQDGPSVWRDAASEGILITGVPLTDLTAAA